MNNTYYNTKASEFIEQTVSLDMSGLTSKIANLIPAGGRVLDMGCGSGRDAKWFVDHGFDVTAFDACLPLVESASQLTGLSVIHSDFESFKSEGKFDCIFALASLLHASAESMPSIFAKYASMLTDTGIFYCSFKFGSGDREQGGRFFTDCDHERIKLFIEGSGLVISESWVTGDVRKELTESQRWLNLILVRGD